jgi:hypothetical protein
MFTGNTQLHDPPNVQDLLVAGGGSVVSITLLAEVLTVAEETVVSEYPGKLVSRQTRTGSTTLHGGASSALRDVKLLLVDRQLRHCHRLYMIRGE